MSMAKLGWIAVPIMLLATIALAHGGATGIVKERMDQMVSISKAAKVLVAMMKREVPYDPVEAGRLAGEIERQSGSALTGLFPEGSLHKPTEARPEIWTNWAAFAAKAEQMRVAAKTLADVAARDAQRSDPDLPSEALLALAETCRDCHRDFRIKKP